IPLPNPKAPPSDNGHDARGRFTKGNKAGRGNPHARQVAALRKALLETVTEQDMIEIAHALMIQAKMGDVAAATLLLAYTLGKPLEGADPDRLDQNEWETMQANSVEPAQASDALERLSLPDFLPVLQVAADCRQQTINHQLLDDIHEIDERQATPRGPEVPPSPNGRKERRPAPAPNPPPAPSPNGGNGPATAPMSVVLAAILEALRAGAQQAVPSPNGHNGCDPPSANG